MDFSPGSLWFKIINKDPVINICLIPNYLSGYTHKPTQGHMHCWPGHLRYPIESTQHRAWHGNPNTLLPPIYLGQPQPHSGTKTFSLQTKLICMVSSILCLFSLFRTSPLPSDGRLPNHRTAAHPQAPWELTTEAATCPQAWIIALCGHHLHVKIMSASQY